MKLILFYAPKFSYTTAKKSLPGIPDVAEDARQREVEHAVVIFFQVEAEDEENRAAVVKKFVKNAKWLCGKFATKNVVLHSFNHLSLSKGSPEFSQGVLDEVIVRLQRTEYCVIATPFGYFNEFNLHVAGDSLAKVYKEF